MREHEENLAEVISNLSFSNESCYRFEISAKTPDQIRTEISKVTNKKIEIFAPINIDPPYPIQYGSYSKKQLDAVFDSIKENRNIKLIFPSFMNSRTDDGKCSIEHIKEYVKDKKLAGKSLYIGNLTTKDVAQLSFISGYVDDNDIIPVKREILELLPQSGVKGLIAGMECPRRPNKNNPQNVHDSYNVKKQEFVETLKQIKSSNIESLTLDAQNFTKQEKVLDLLSEVIEESNISYLAFSSLSFGTTEPFRDELAKKVQPFLNRNKKANEFFPGNKYDIDSQKGHKFLEAVITRLGAADDSQKKSFIPREFAKDKGKVENLAVAMSRFISSKEAYNLAKLHPDFAKAAETYIPSYEVTDELRKLYQNNGPVRVDNSTQSGDRPLAVVDESVAVASANPDESTISAPTSRGIRKRDGSHSGEESKKRQKTDRSR